MIHLDKCLKPNVTNIEMIVECFFNAMSQLLQIGIDNILSPEKIAGSPAQKSALLLKFDKLKIDSETSKRDLAAKLKLAEGAKASLEQQLEAQKKLVRAASTEKCSKCPSLEAENNRLKEDIENLKLQWKQHLDQLNSKTIECDSKEKIL